MSGGLPSAGSRQRDDATLKGEPIMSLASHLAELQRKHGDLDQAISSPSTDDLEIARLKRRKLAIKDEIERLQAPTRH
jgi:hypothetical protein